MDVAAARVRVKPCDTRLQPQSAMRGLPWSSRSTLPGFRSPCMMPRPCKCTSPWPRTASTHSVTPPPFPHPSQPTRPGAVPAICHAAPGTLPSHFAGVRGSRATPSSRHRCTTASGCTCRSSGSACGVVFVRLFVRATSREPTATTHVNARMDGIRKYGLHRHDAWVLHTARDHNLDTRAGR